MSFSVNTNVGAMTALQYLNQTQGQLAQTQSAINSGMTVADARDNGAIFAIAQNQRAAVAGYTSVVNSINNGTSSIDVALSAGQSISDLLIQMKTAALSASVYLAGYREPSGPERQLNALLGQITTIVRMRRSTASTWSTVRPIRSRLWPRLTAPAASRPRPRT